MATAYSYDPIEVDASVTLGDAHTNGVVVVNKADGWTVTLPAATGSGDAYTVVVGTTISSNAGIIATTGGDLIQGAVAVSSDIAGVTCRAPATATGMSMNGSTTGAVIGTRITFTDVADGMWLASGALVSTGVEATPFTTP